MQPPTDFRNMSDDDWRELQDRSDRFADALAKNKTVDWKPFVDGLTGNLRVNVLHEFIKIDLESAWKGGRRAFLDDYLRKFPELGGPFDLPAHLVFEEYRIRTAHGDKPEPESYLTRFPNIAETLRGLFGTGTDNQTRRDSQDAFHATMSRRPIDQSVSLPRDHVSVRPDTVLPGAGEYQLLEALGRGQFGEVWRAKAPGGVEVAVKILSQPSDRESAKREIQALELVKNLRHPALMATLAFFEVDKKLHIVVELADGTLRDRLKHWKKQGQPGIPAEELVKVFETAADGIDFLHSKHIYHRDIKPDNILLMSGHAKVADFGLARLQERQDMSVSFAGTPVYMAPEVWGGKFNNRSDLYSLAITYAELRLGRRPLDGSDFVELMTKQLEEAPNLEGLPPAEKAVVARALSKQPDKRQATCSEFTAELRASLKAPPPKSGKQPRPQIPATERGGRPPIALIIGGLLLVAGAAFATWFFFLREDGSKPTTGSQTGTTGVETTSVPPKPTPTKPPNGIGKPPIADPVLLTPTGYTAEGKDEVVIDNRKYARYVRKELEGGTSIRLKLVQPPNGTPFYIQVTKTSIGQWQSFNRAKPGLVRDTSLWANQPLDLPVANMLAREALEFARWADARLPTPEEWDAAAGFKSGVGDTNANLITKGTAAFSRGAPRPVEDEGRDWSKEGIADLFGNGREWTAGILVPPNKTGTISPTPGERDIVILRGRMYTLSKPLSTEIMEYELKVPQTQFAGSASKYTGLRLAADLPK